MTASRSGPDTHEAGHKLSGDATECSVGSNESECSSCSLFSYSVCSVRLSVRTHAFHACKRGSIPLPSTTDFMVR